jgi:hypothetical protein
MALVFLRPRPRDFHGGSAEGAWATGAVPLCCPPTPGLRRDVSVDWPAACLVDARKRDAGATRALVAGGSSPLGGAWRDTAPRWSSETTESAVARRAKVEARGYGRSNVDAGPHRRSTFGASGEPGAGVLSHCGVSACPIRSLTEKTGMLRTATRVVPRHPRRREPPADLLDDSPRSLMSLFPRSFV